MHFCRITSVINQQLHLQKISHKTLQEHLKLLPHVSILSDHHQGALLFLAKVILHYSQFNSFKDQCVLIIIINLITNFSTKYREKLITHPNELISALLEDEETRRLKHFKPTELQRDSHKHRTQIREHLM